MAASRRKGSCSINADNEYLDSSTDFEISNTSGTSEYLPHSSDDSENVETDITPASTQFPDTASGHNYNPGTSNDQTDEPVKWSRKRVRNLDEWRKNIKKRLCNTGQEYCSVSNKKIPRKEFVPTQHKCRLKCDEKIAENEQKDIFNKFWELGTWDLQSQFICGAVQVSDVHRHRVGAQKEKGASRTFYLGDKKVCKKFFIQVLNVSQGRVQRCVERQVKNACVGSTDQRGRHSPFNKTPGDRIQLVKEHINSFPKYQSHYSRNHNQQRKYLSPTLDIAKMYNLYKIKCEECHQKPVSEWVYRNVFNTKFNLSFHPPSTDTCQHCDRLQIKINGCSGEEKETLQIEKELHLRKAQKVISDKKDTVEAARKSKDMHVCVFDLQKTLPSPILTNIVYYKRQLWTYNLGVHNLVNGVANMFMWDEATAKRGSQEVGSCILKYVLNLPTTVKHLTAYTDTCGGQNRNEKLAKIWMYIVENTNIELVDHKFFESGHSFNECDADFAVIEKKKKKNTEIYVPESWMNHVASCRPGKFIVHRMIREDFVSTENMNKVTVVRKKDEDKDPVSWLKIKWMRFSRNKPLCMQFKYNVNADINFRELNFDKKLYRKGKPDLPKELSQLYNAAIAIKKEKVKDLMQLLQFIPAPYHAFYKNLISTEDEDDINEDPGIDDYDNQQ